MCIYVLHYFPDCSQFDTGRWPSSVNHSFVRSFVLSSPPPHTHTLSLSFALSLLSASFSLAGNSDHLTCVRHSSRKSSATHSCQYVQYFRVSRQRYRCQWLGLCACMPDCIRGLFEHRDRGKRDSNPRQHCGWSFQWDALPAELSAPTPMHQ